MRILPLAFAPVAAVLAISLTGCSTADKKTPVTSQDDTPYTDYVNCLQKHGVKASFTRDAQGQAHLDADTGPKDPTFVAAQQACVQYAPSAMTKTASPAELDTLVKVAACLRKQGITVKDPTADDPALHLSGDQAGSAKAEQIKAACEKEVQGASPSS